jgi:hypothetical protein
MGVWGWYLRFWAPIPVSLFAKTETRTFRIEARVRLRSWMDDYEMLNDGALSDFDILSAQGDMSVSHLRKEREMA